MKIIISPAKIQNGLDSIDRPLIKIKYPIKTNKLHHILKAYSKEELAQLMHIKNKLLNDTYDNLHQRKSLQHAITLYNGIVYKAINTQSYDPLQLDYMQRHLCILSAYYGVLEPLTGIFPYRLDMTMKPEAINLYKYWTLLNEYFKDTLIINLASIEYSTMISRPMLNIFFKEEQSDGSLKIITVRAKKARGLMVDFLIEHLIEEVEQIKAFCECGYTYQDHLSDKNNYIFVIPYE